VPALRIVVTAELDGVPIKGFPWVRRLAIDEIQSFEYEQANHGDAITFSTVPADQLATIQALLLRPDKAVTLRLDGQTDAGIAINADGFVLLCDVTIDAGAGASNAKLNNNSGSTAIVQGTAVGT